MGVDAGRKFRHAGTPPDSYRVVSSKKPRAVFDEDKRNFTVSKKPFTTFQSLSEGIVRRPKSFI